jgi:SH3-like domain-containing protein
MVLAMQGTPEPVLAQPGEVTGSTADAPVQVGPSGLPLPRFVTLKASKVNVRKGPSHEHAIAWVFLRKGLPVEVTAESDNWRKIRDSDGSEGWIQQSMLTGKRNALVASWVGKKGIMLRAQPNAKAEAVVNLAGGVMGQIDSCNGGWCYLSTQDYEGYARQDELWGVYPGEVVD